ncbi:unnamed protein product [Natator depressus]
MGALPGNALDERRAHQGHVKRAGDERLGTSAGNRGGHEHRGGWPGLFPMWLMLHLGAGKPLSWGKELELPPDQRRPTLLPGLLFLCAHAVTSTPQHRRGLSNSHIAIRGNRRAQCWLPGGCGIWPFLAAQTEACSNPDGAGDCFSSCCAPQLRAERAGAENGSVDVAQVSGADDARARGIRRQRIILGSPSSRGPGWPGNKAGLAEECQQSGTGCCGISWPSPTEPGQSELGRTAE